MSREEQVEAMLAEHEYAIGLKRSSICICGHIPTVEPKSLRTQQDYHRTHLAAVLTTILADERAAALREAADATYEHTIIGQKGTRTVSRRSVLSADVRQWLRARADEVTR